MSTSCKLGGSAVSVKLRRTNRSYTFDYAQMPQSLFIKAVRKQKHPTDLNNMSEFMF